MENRTHGYLLLEDSARFDGERLLGPAGALGEAVFNTSHSGYQEVLTDPSYQGQLVVFTAPHQGNVGVNPQDMESDGVRARGAVVRSLAPSPSSWRSAGRLEDWLGRAGAPLLVGADTRAVALHLRTRGAMRAGLFSAEVSQEQALSRVLGSPRMDGADLAAQVTCKEPYRVQWQAPPLPGAPGENRDTPPKSTPEGGQGAGWGPGQGPPEGAAPGPVLWLPPTAWHPPVPGSPGAGLSVAVLDFGVKRSILQELLRRGCAVTVLPASTGADALLAGGYHGVLLSNGPGDPAAVQGVQPVVQRLIQAAMPLFGICLGHQILGLAAGAATFKLPFGHRGANHPVRRLADGVVEITSQNHGFAVRPGGLQGGFAVSHVNLNDGTVEGLAHPELPVFSVQYHPEASPGPRDSLGYFDRFVQEMRRAPR